MKTKLEIVKERNTRKEQDRADILALTAEIKAFNETLNGKEDIDLTELKTQLIELPELIAEPITKSLGGFLDSFEPYLKKSVQKQNTPDLPGLLKDLKIEAPTLDLKPVAKEIAKLNKKVEKQSQQPEDYQPYRRVVKLGNKFFFDDNMTSSGSGGGGSTFDTTGLATEDKQDDIITAIEGISGGSSATPLDTYTYIQKDTSGGTYKYYGYADANTPAGWAIKRITISTNLAEYIKGTTDYSTNWTGRAGLTYADIWSTF